MVIFWLTACGMICIALFFLLRPFFRHRSSGPDQKEAELTVYRNRLVEIQNEVESGLLSEADARMAEIELKKNLLHEAGESDNAAARTAVSGLRNWWTIGISSVLLPVMATTIYLSIGSPDLVEPISQPGNPHAGSALTHESSVEEMVARLAARLEKQPDDPEGWMMLTNSYMALERYQQAAAAAARMYELYGNEPSVMLRYADALAMANNNRMSGKPAELVRKALELDPDNITGLWLAGMAESEQGNYAVAIDYWQRLTPLLANDQASLAEVEQLIGLAKAQMGDTQPIISPADGQPETASNPVSIFVSVTLSPALAKDINPGDTLFVYAKAVDGPPMPLAAVREKAESLPLQVILDDSMAMFPGMKLSDHEQVQIGARISKSGGVMAKSGDLYGETADIINTRQTDTVSIIIDQRVP